MTRAAQFREQMVIKSIGDRADANRCAIVSMRPPEIEARPPVLTLWEKQLSPIARLAQKQKYYKKMLPQE